MALLSSFKDRLDTALRYGAAYALVAFLFILNVIALPYPFAAPIKTPLFFMALYYWSIYRPRFFPSWLAFVSGLLMDIISGLPIGLNAFVFVVFQWVIVDQRRILTGQSFFVVWTGFAALLSAAQFIQWALFGFITGVWPSLEPLLISLALAFALFPLVAIAMHSTHKLLPIPHPLKLFKGKGNT